MRKLISRRPSPAMLVALIALVLALGGTAVAAKKLGLGVLSKGAKNKTVGVGKLVYVTTTTQASNPLSPSQPVNSAVCPSGLKVIGGGIKLTNPGAFGGTLDSTVLDSYATAGGWSGRVLFDETGETATTTAICAVSRVVKGSPPGS
jgi:hypothetical protein